ncbi:sugar transferase [Ilumatobacter coccineus]|uniref:Putative undecaprenyl-phosphate glycosylphosphotransferase n=1 Tax=Ilumatobacter coccineus (strain NBRC 103263 / KCTC 29153 / YM16-304) TaxID=1313172 RepID=A0A6C7E5K1_ILUCY|nr:sugar transferase [Ilumatobacter coccineus]BAN01743.1 putative undecaprenyl-phosphate glycosylphosphotransferase [Ilumatobacter coccineus YM16-304]
MPSATGDDAPTTLTSRQLKSRLVVADAVAMAVGVVAAFAIQAILRPVPRFVMSSHLMLVVASLPFFAVGAGFNRLYKGRANERRMEEASNILKAVGVGMSGLLLISLASQYNELSRLWVLLLAFSISTALLLERRFARSLFARMRSQGRLQRRIIIVGTDAHAIGLMHAYERNPSLGYKVVGFAGDDDLGERGGVAVLGTIDNICHVLDEHDAVGVVVSLSSVDSDEVNVLTRRLTDAGYHVALSSSLRDIDIARIRPQTLDGRTMIYVEPVMRNGWQESAKRTFDVCLALTILVVTLPIQIIAGLLIAFTSRGPVFFRQIRIGKDGELFEVLKFRTMEHNAEQRKHEFFDQNEADGPLFKIRKDPRITKVGGVLRKLSIDELPQLFCVLIGSMSMVGPRPALPSEFEQWDDSVRERLRVLPGLTGMWQVSGRSDASFETYKRLDLYYVDNWSLLHDLKICARTIGVVLTGRGAA